MGRPSRGVLISILLSFAAPSVFADTITSLESAANVPLTDGSGAGTIHFIIPAGQQKPAVEWTAPTAADGHVLPGDIKADLADPGPPSSQRIATLTINVKKAEGAVPNVAYGAKMVLLVPQAVTVPFTVTRLSSANIDVAPSTSSTTIVFRDTLSRSIRVRNNGNIPVSISKIDSLGFIGAGNNRFYEAKPTCAPMLIPPGSQKITSVTLPDIDRAGTYTGTFEVTTDAGAHQSATFTIVTRGPYASCGLPPLLFLLTVVAGYGLALIIERWLSDASMQRLETERRMRLGRATLLETRSALDQWNAAHGNALVKVPALIAGDLAQTERTLSTLADLTPAQLLEAALAAGNAAAFAEAFVRVLAETTRTAKPSELDDKAKAMDAVPRQGTLGEYVTKLYQAAASPAPEHGAAALQAAEEKSRTPEEISREICLITWWRNVALFVVALLVAATLHYLGHPQFGTASDYIAVFIWGLGLTQGGAQLVAKVRSVR
jgi:hypothetical protein